MKQLKGVYPISGEDLAALPVKEIGPAVAFYETVLAFSVLARDETTATLKRDDARLGLVQKPDHKPEEAGSCAFAVTDLHAMRAELEGRGLAEEEHPILLPAPRVDPDAAQVEAAPV